MHEPVSHPLPLSAQLKVGAKLVQPAELYDVPFTGELVTVTVGLVVSLHWAVEVPPLTGIVAGIVGDHPVNVYPVFNGGVGVEIDVPKFCVTDAGEAGVVAPLPANVYVYEIGV